MNTKQSGNSSFLDFYGFFFMNDLEFWIISLSLELNVIKHHATGFNVEIQCTFFTAHFFVTQFIFQFLESFQYNFVGFIKVHGYFLRALPVLGLGSSTCTDGAMICPSSLMSNALRSSGVCAFKSCGCFVTSLNTCFLAAISFFFC